MKNALNFLSLGTLFVQLDFTVSVSSWLYAYWAKTNNFSLKNITLRATVRNKGKWVLDADF